MPPRPRREAHAIYLIPGFFGFSNLGRLRYFTHVDRFLRERLAERGVDARVSVVRTHPTASLSVRAARVLEGFALGVAPRAGAVAAPVMQGADLEEDPAPAEGERDLAALDPALSDKVAQTLDTADTAISAAAILQKHELGARDLAGAQALRDRLLDATLAVEEAPDEDLKYEEGVVAMAKTGAEPAGTSGSQFFIVTGAGAASLTPDYALLGEVTSGMDVAKKIGAIQADPNTGQPAAVVVIKSIKVEES